MLYRTYHSSFGTLRLRALLAISFFLSLSARLIVGAEEPAFRDPATLEFTAEQEHFFETRVRPVLASRCYECHGPEKQESGLRLDGRAFILKGGDAEEPAAVVGKPDESTLIAAVRYDGDLQMPPDEKLSDEEIEALTAWVAMGLPWPKTDDQPVVLTKDEVMRLARERHWAFQPIQRPELPPVTDSRWPATATDHFILGRLESRGLTPSGPADRPTLIRRATFDLHGLPPSPDEIDAFVNDDAPDAYARLVDRLLASPRYGERWGRHWLDVARYADTRGYAFNRDRRYPYAYTYRDYVIRSLNADKPYDQFVREQLAADLMELGEDTRALAALGYLTVGRKFNNRHDDLDDQIDVVGRGLMGLTIACARCHDHKYDPIPAEDYYSLYGVFASSNEPDELPLIGKPEETPGYDEFQKKLDELTEARQAILVEQHQKLLDTSRGRVVEYLVRVTVTEAEEELKKLSFLSLGSDDLKKVMVDRWRDYLHKSIKADDALFGPLLELTKLSDDAFAEQSAAILQRWRDLPAGTEPGQANPLVIEKLTAEPPASRADVARSYGELLANLYGELKPSGDLAAVRAGLDPVKQQLAAALLDAGTPTDVPLDQITQYQNRAERERVTAAQTKIDGHQASSPGAPARAMVLKEQPNPHDPRVFQRGNHARPGKPVPRQFLHVLSGDDREPFKQGSGRLELAEKIVEAENPLTRRVIANRIWMHHFGEPLVDTPSDFGVRSERPVHAELLDHLASLLAEQSWSLKALHRELMLSSTYQQSSLDRPEAREVDPENRLLWRMNRRRLEFEIIRDALLAAGDRLDLTLYGRPVDLTSRPFQSRRAVYGYIDRQDLPNLLRVFDFASPDQSSPVRPRTTVPQQALYMMNSPFVMEQARAAAGRPELSDGELPERIPKLYQFLFGRHPSAEELEVGLRFVEQTPPNPNREVKLSGWEQYVQLLLLTNEFVFVD